MKDTTACAGCHNNFYNGNNPYGVKRCWSADTAEIKTRFTLSVHTPMHLREAYHAEQLPSCYKRKGYVHLDAIPHYAQTREQRAAEQKEKEEREARLANYVPPPPRVFPSEISDPWDF